MAKPDAATVSVALAFLRSKHDYRTLELDADLVRGVIRRATERAAQGDDVVDERLRHMKELHRNTIKGVEGLFTPEEMARGREVYGNDNQSWVRMLHCVMDVVRGQTEPEQDLREEVEHLERELRTVKAEKGRYREALREVATGRADGADVAQAALGGGEIVGRVARSGKVAERLTREQVWCHGCGKTHPLNTYEALNNGKWPECCGRPMAIDSPAERQAEAENSL